MIQIYTLTTLSGLDMSAENIVATQQQELLDQAGGLERLAAEYERNARTQHRLGASAISGAHIADARAINTEAKAYDLQPPTNKIMAHVNTPSGLTLKSVSPETTSGLDSLVDRIKARTRGLRLRYATTGSSTNATTSGAPYTGGARAFSGARKRDKIPGAADTAGGRIASQRSKAAIERNWALDPAGKRHIEVARALGIQGEVSQEAVKERVSNAAANRAISAPRVNSSIGLEKRIAGLSTQEEDDKSKKESLEKELLRLAIERDDMIDQPYGNPRERAEIDKKIHQLRTSHGIVSRRIERGYLHTRREQLEREKTARFDTQRLIDKIMGVPGTKQIGMIKKYGDYRQTPDVPFGHLITDKNAGIEIGGNNGTRYLDVNSSDFIDKITKELLGDNHQLRERLRNSILKNLVSDRATPSPYKNPTPLRGIVVAELQSLRGELQKQRNAVIAGLPKAAKNIGELRRPIGRREKRAAEKAANLARRGNDQFLNAAALAVQRKREAEAQANDARERALGLREEAWRTGRKLRTDKHKKS